MDWNMAYNIKIRVNTMDHNNKRTHTFVTRENIALL